MSGGASVPVAGPRWSWLGAWRMSGALVGPRWSWLGGWRMSGALAGPRWSWPGFQNLPHRKGAGCGGRPRPPVRRRSRSSSPPRGASARGPFAPRGHPAGEPGSACWGTQRGKRLSHRNLTDSLTLNFTALAEAVCTATSEKRQFRSARSNT